MAPLRSPTATHPGPTRTPKSRDSANHAHITSPSPRTPSKPSNKPRGALHATSLHPTNTPPANTPSKRSRLLRATSLPTAPHPSDIDPSAQSHASGSHHWFKARTALSVATHLDHHYSSSTPHWPTTSPIQSPSFEHQQLEQYRTTTKILIQILAYIGLDEECLGRVVDRLCEGQSLERSFEREGVWERVGVRVEDR
ncbi:MAG: hypothetical protein Q9227_000162 [Pyrenula ochraceoflavens]